MRKDIDPLLIDDLKVIGSKIRQLRKERSNLNYKEFTEQLQKGGVMISKNTLQRIEIGDSYNLSSFLALLKYFDVKLSDFFLEAGL